MYYEEMALWDWIGIVPYTMNTVFPFTCKTMVWANNRIRTVYNSGVGQNFTGISWNSSKVEEDFDPLKKHAHALEFGLDPDEHVNLTQFFYFKRISYFKNGIKFEPSENLIGMNSSMVIFSTDNAT